nr:immunoglobulin light chain junction region [Macaca mulatta]MOW72255.1 immunoglobulin light chain junction region [Macaca mulatta]
VYYCSSYAGSNIVLF